MPSVQQLIAGFERAARERLAADVYDFVAGGSGDEVSLDAAAAAWRRHRLAPHVLRDVSTVDTSVELMGSTLPAPIGCAPVAFQGRLHPDGELGVVGEHLTVVSTRASRPIETISSGARGPWWLQVYLTVDRSIIAGHVVAAAQAGARALVLTGDTPYVGRKARAGRPDPVDPAREQDPSATTDAIAWLHELTGLPVLVKGVLRGDDARRCLDAGAAGLVVSNHGGRQLDRAVASADALSGVVAAAGDAPVLVDGGIRCGLDVLVALALGARAVLLGRPIAWALAAGGGDAVRELMATMTDELAHVMGLAGCPAVRDVTRDLIAQCE